MGCIVRSNSEPLTGPVMAAVAMTTAGVPLGLAYAVWTGIGAAGTFLVGVAVFGEVALLLHWVGVALILGGVACLKLA